MTEEKDILLKYLCMALPYGVIIHIHDINVEDFDNYLCENYLLQIRAHEIIAKPYLRPMSSMTNVERQEYGLVLCDELSILGIDWLNAHHFDYRGLIEKGLALEASKGMYK